MILRGTPATISAQWLADEAATDPGEVSVTVLRADGTTLTSGPAAGTLTGPRTFNLTASHTTQLDTLRAVWTSGTHGSVTTYHEIVGGFYVDLATLRDQPNLGDTARFPTAKLNRARRWWAQLVDGYCGQAFVPTHRIETKRMRRGETLRLGRPNVRDVYSAALAGVAIDTAGWVLHRSGRVDEVTTALYPGVLTVSYEHGTDAPDADLYEAGITAMRSWLMTDSSGRASRQTLISNELGTVRLAQPGEKRPTGIPDVDAVLNRHVWTDLLVA